MNLLSHAFVAHQESDRFLLGTSLPDLLSIYNRKLRMPPLIDHMKAELDVSDDLIQGIACHIRIDQEFHNSQFFLEGQRFLRIRLEALPHIQIKRFFLAHILFEILLDRFLLLNFPYFIERYYSIFIPARCQEITKYISYTHQLSPDEFREFLTKFVGSRFLYSYCEYGEIVKRCERIIQRIRKGNHSPFSRTDYETLIALLAEAETELRPAISHYFQPQIATFSQLSR